ncbi:hypothetical protein [Ramlibacter humi]|uniref:Uncharacterized protein n=1 Tax=Ramlibacter humi TaxID=2530451 RepID=A0A4Z0BGN7_9BURK|nr:hypothetical protein [Ramlibacter humi]TFY97623.1 hypothetical protein EZ216_18010 [Ramlibacter humi]
MKPIDQKAFSKLRLPHLLPGKPVYRVWNFEYLGSHWLGHVHGFSHVLRPYSSPFRTVSIAIDMRDASDEDLRRASARLGMHMDRSLTAQECLDRYGAPLATQEFASDRKTFCFRTSPGYEVGLTILNAGGLVYFTMDSERATRTS